MRRGLYLIGAILWVALITYMSSLPPSRIPIKLDWMQAFGPAAWNFAHFGAFCLLAVLVTGALDPAGRLPGLGSATGRRAVFLVALYAVVDESHQWFVPHRTSSTADVLVDILGALFAVLWPAIPFRGELARPNSLRPAVLVFLLGLSLAYLGATMDLPLDHLVADATEALFGPR